MKTAPTKSAALYVRISTDKQETDAQRVESASYALAENLPITKTVEDTASGSLPWRKRGLGALVDARPAYTDLLVYDYDRIGRDMVDTLEFLKTCQEAGISVHITKSRTVIRSDLSGKIMATVMALAAEIERSLLRSRTSAALKERQRKIATEGGFTSKAGVYRTKLGRPAGTAKISKLDEHAAELANLFTANVADAAIARIYKCHRVTVATARAKWLNTKK